MIDQKHIDLMNTEIDGVNTDEQSRELAAFLESNEEAREYFDGLRATARTINSIRNVDAPASLYHRVMSRITRPAEHAHGAHASYESRGGVGDWLRGLFARPQLRLATSFAVGLAIGVTIYAVITDDGSFRQPLDLSEFAGTMATLDSRNGLDQIADLDVSLAGVSGYVRLHQTGETVIADVALESDRPIQWVLSYDAAEVTLDGFRHLGRPGDFSSTTSETRATLNGENRYVLLFKESAGVPSPMTLRIYSDDKVVYESVIPES